MDGRWVVDADSPGGRFVPLTQAEEAQLLLDQQAGAIQTAAAAIVATNSQTIRDRLASVLANLEAANANWATLTAAQKDSALRLAVRASAGLIRLFLQQLDSAGT